MAKDSYDWKNGATLDEHSRIKHKILRKYIFDYICIRCPNMLHMKEFKLAFIDGFCGGGRYKCGAVGSPIIFLEELQCAYKEIQARRAEQNLSPIYFHCYLICIDTDKAAVEQLRGEFEVLAQAAKESCPYLKLTILYECAAFETRYPRLKNCLLEKKIRNVLFYLDPCGYTQLSQEIIKDIISAFESPEVFYTFMLGAALRYQDKTNAKELAQHLTKLGILQGNLAGFRAAETVNARIAEIERLLWGLFQNHALYVSALSVHYSHGYRRYWLLHFAKKIAARLAYNNVLHKLANSQVHIGGAGLLAYQTQYEAMPYLFSGEDRENSKEILQRHAYDLVHKNDEAMRIEEFWRSAYRASFNHGDDINSAIIECEEIEIITPNGRKRRKSPHKGDMLRIRPQKSFFSFGWDK